MDATLQALPTRRVKCAECGTVLTIRDRDHTTVYVETVGTLPDECCQSAATEKHVKVGMFATIPRAK